MMRLEEPFSRDGPHPRAGLPLMDSLRWRLGGLVMRLTPLWPQITRLDRWLEDQAASGPADRPVLLEVAPEAQGRPAGLRSERLSADVDGYIRLGSFLGSLGITRVELDPHLAGRQVADVLSLLFACRRPLGRHPRDTRARLVRQLLSPHGVHVSCARAWLDGDTLRVADSYCMTRFNQLVQVFKRRHRVFSDYRSILLAAPRFSLLAAVVTLAPFLLYALEAGRWAMLAISLAGAGAVFGMVYLFFTILGSVAYDNEVKAQRLSSAYEQLRRYALRTREDLGRARVIQQRMLPDMASMPLADRLDWASRFMPETEVGGDYYDVAAIDGGKAAILFGDVSGHGMSAAFITAIMKTAFQSWAEDGGPWLAFFQRLNHMLCRLTPEDAFAAVFLAVYDPASGELCYANGGHYPEPWLIPADPQRPIESLSDARAILMGVEEDVAPQPSRRVLRAGDKVVFVTDGLVEARDPSGNLYAPQRLVDVLNEHRGQPVGRLVELVVHDVTRFAQEAEQNDDWTVLAFQVKG